VTLDSGEVLNLTDFQVVDEAALNALGDSDFLDLRKSGALAMIYCHLASSNSWNALARPRREKRRFHLCSGWLGQGAAKSISEGAKGG
jgi:hypothetical protein